MNELELSEGFKFWSNEVSDLVKPEMFVPYIPAIALIGIYTASINDPERLNSYNWRQAVLANHYAVDGMKKSLSSLHRDRMDEEYETPIDILKPEEGAALQRVCAYESLIDGLPISKRVVLENELFLAETLGFAEHDYGVTLYPLRISTGGIECIRNNYPQTAELLKDKV